MHSDSCCDFSKCNFMSWRYGNADSPQLTRRCAPRAALGGGSTRTQHGYSAEPEVREILTIAVEPEMHVHPNEALAALSDKIGRTNEDFEVVHHVHDKAPIEPLRFE